ncbi:MAG: hypothetical protein QOF96_801 [Actinomycetota bacterium]|jgi:quercetin dioxygenase-like cupin family protein|nr:hypothetical protein [Actinomycetota bacterium]
MRRLPVLVFSAVAITTLGLTVALATPPAGLTRTETSRTALVGGGPVEFKPGFETVVLHVTLDPGGSTGWHSHPGPGIFMVDKGTLSNYGLDGAACTPLKINAGQGYFVPEHAHHPHLARNDGTEPLELTITYFNVPPGQPTRIDAGRPAECPADLN